MQVTPQQMPHGGALPANFVPGAIHFEVGDFGKALKVMNAERMQLEGVLREEENARMKEFAEQKVRNLSFRWCRPCINLGKQRFAPYQCKYV